MDAPGFVAWRKRVGITQEELAERAGVTRTTVQNWESGATPVPTSVAAACSIWERRLRQENPGLGPVTLIFADAPMFVDPYGPRGRLATIQQEAYACNAAAIARVLKLSRGDKFYSPFIIEKSGADLWNIVELERVVRGADREAPTPANLLRRLAKHIKETSTLYARSGAKLPSTSQAKKKRERIEALAAEIETLASVAGERSVSYSEVDERLSALRALGKFAPNSLVFGIAAALGQES